MAYGECESKSRELRQSHHYALRTYESERDSPCLYTGLIHITEEALGCIQLDKPYIKRKYTSNWDLDLVLSVLKYTSDISELH